MSNTTSSTEAREINIAGAVLMGLVAIIGIMLWIGPPEGTRSIQANTPVCEDLVSPPGMTVMGAATTFASNHPEIPRTQINDMFVQFAESKGINPSQPLPLLENGALSVCLKPDRSAVDWVYVK